MAAPVKPIVSVEFLNRLDIRVGTIEAAADVQGSDRLVGLTVNFGDHRRTIVAGRKQEREVRERVDGAGSVPDQAQAYPTRGVE